MKRFFLKILEFKLVFFAKRVLSRYQPKIVAVAGSVGKTSTVQAIALALAKDFRVGQTLRSYNQELGVPLSILRQETGYRSLWRWLKIFLRAAGLAFGRKKSDFPQVLVLELGADKPGDLERLLNWVKPEIGVLTSATVEHVEFFGSIEAAIAEEQKLVKSLPKNAVAVLNADDPNVVAATPQIRAKIIRYSQNQSAEVQVNNAAILGENVKNLQGVSAKISVSGSSIPVVIQDTVGRHSLYAVAAAFAVAHALQVNLSNVSEQLRKYQPPAGRMRLLKGVKDTLIIDDTYNSSPAAAKAALDTLAELETPAKKYAILGDMRELGPVSEEEHVKIGQYVLGKADYLITVGEQAKHIANGAKFAGFPIDRILSFDKPEGVGNFLQDRLLAQDLILVKGSQGIRCEKVVKEIMAEPERASELLTRQYWPWI
ncbi:UDP-N-acetylmuramoyl-tripeptide--D-alanyl-D-alanine ligase [Candidatus Parcubacteria bacterium]|jgi:UDP-N-acetylmuramyl pentapeptide synthase|nr:MAG: UDP-N-acetylmuramoyl-tripeptide--D-alanyl-D-alanine ligase [Candidatus Parcubacteria bacterium]